MPELPEVEIVCRGLIPVMEGAIINSLKTTRPNLRTPFPENFSEKVKNSKIIKINRRAKYAQLILNNDLTIVIHLGMSGVIKIITPEEKYENAKHDHMIISLNNGYKIILNDPRRFGMVLLINSNEINEHKSFSSLGPEPFSNEFNGEYLYKELQKRTGKIKSALLDQSLIAGLGNIYVCEALFDTSICPTRKSNSLTKEDAENLVIASKEILDRAIKAGGSTLKDYRHVNGDLGYFQHQFKVYGKEGQKCPECNCDITKTNGIKRINQSGRSSFYCQNKQK